MATTHPTARPYTPTPLALFKIVLLVPLAPLIKILILIRTFYQTINNVTLTG